MPDGNQRSFETEFVEHLQGSGGNFDAVTDVEAIRRLEGEADDVRHETIAEAFADGATIDALAVREAVLALDAVPDAVEDAADHLCYVQSAGV